VSQAHLDWTTSTQQTIARLQRELIAVEVDQIETLVRSAADAITPAPDTAHRALLSLLLVDVCRQMVVTLHEPHVFAECACYRTGWLEIAALTSPHVDGPQRSFVQWTTGFLACFTHAHPPDGATLAAALVRGAPTRIWTLLDLSRAVRWDPRRLAREFLACFGLRPSDYLHLARIATALRLLRVAGKIEAVVCDVGYRSKKDFYAAFKRWVGMTPTELRALPDEERDWMELQLRSRLFQRRQTSPEEIGRNDTLQAVTSPASPFAIPFAHGRGERPSSRRRPPHRRSARLPRT
jgi:AraC-like DNA-binding protein